MKRKKRKHNLSSGSLSIVVLSPGEEIHKSMDLLEHLHIPIYVGIPSGCSRQFPENIRPLFLRRSNDQCWQFITGASVETEWALFLEEDEYLDKKNLELLSSLFSGMAKDGNKLGVTRFLLADEIKQFDWVSTRNIFTSPTKSMTAYHAIELRLIPAELLGEISVQFPTSDKSASRFMVNLPPGKKDIFNKDLSSLSILRLESSTVEQGWVPPEDRAIFIKGHSKFFDDAQFIEEFHWPRTLYLLIRMDHVPVILKGLKEGLTSRGIVMYTIMYLLQMGEFELAKEFLPFIPEHWEVHEPLLSQMKAMVYFFAEDMDSAGLVLEQSLDNTHDNPVIMENLGKLFLLLGKREMARKLFQKIIETREDWEDKSHLDTFLATLEENPGKWPTLSVCMVCRDEEKLLPQALKSVRGLADEIIVVDTGSQDRTKEIAKDFGARVFEMPWENDFAKARNFAFQQATSDYVLMLDADEHIVTLNLVDFHVMKRLLPIKSPRAFMLSIGHLKTATDWIIVLTGGSNFVPETQAIRIIPRLPGIKFTGRIEETVVDSLSELNIPVTHLPESQMRIHHDTMDRERRVERKLAAYEEQRDLELSQILAAVRDFSYLNDNVGTARWLKRLTDCAIEERSPIFRQVGIRLAKLIEDESPEEARRLLAKMCAEYPENTEMLVALSSHLIRRGCFADLADLDFSLLEESKKLIGAKEIEYWVHRGLIALERGDIDGSAWILDQVLSQYPENHMGQAARFYLLSKIGDLKSSALALEDILSISGDVSAEAINSPEAFLNTVEKLSEIFRQWGHPVECSLLLNGAMQLSSQIS